MPSASAKLWGKLIRGAEWLCIVSILGIAVIVIYEIVARFVFDEPTIWVQEVAVYLLIASAFLGLAPTHATGQHIRIDLLLNKMPARAQATLEILTCLAIAAFAAVAAWGGAQMVAQSLRFGRKSLTLLAVPAWVPQLLLPLGTGLLALGALGTAWLLWRKTQSSDRR